MMNITTERLQEIINFRTAKHMKIPHVKNEEIQALAQFALDVRVLADKKRWRREEALYEDDYSKGYKQGQWDCADELDALSRSDDEHNH